MMQTERRNNDYGGDYYIAASKLTLYKVTFTGEKKKGLYVLLSKEVSCVLLYVPKAARPVLYAAGGLLGVIKPHLSLGPCFLDPECERIICYEYVPPPQRES